MRNRVFNVVVILTVFVGVAAVAGASNNPNTLTGVWELRTWVDGELIFTFATFNQDGTYFATAPVHTSNKNPQGIWEKTGPKTYVARNWGFVADANGEYTLLAVSTEVIELNNDKMSYTSEVQTEIQDYEGNVLAVVPNTINAFRMTLDY
jgi:hypothetical protein